MFGTLGTICLAVVILTLVISLHETEKTVQKLEERMDKLEGK